MAPITGGTYPSYQAGLYANPSLSNRFGYSVPGYGSYSQATYPAAGSSVAGLTNFANSTNFSRMGSVARPQASNPYGSGLGSVALASQQRRNPMGVINPLSRSAAPPQTRAFNTGSPGLTQSELIRKQTSALVGKLMAGLKGQRGSQGLGVSTPRMPGAAGGLAGLDINQLKAMFKAMLPPQEYAKLAPMFDMLAQYMQQMMLMQQQSLVNPVMAESGGGGGGHGNTGNSGNGGGHSYSNVPSSMNYESMMSAEENGASYAPGGNDSGSVMQSGQLTEGSTYADAQEESEGSPSSSELTGMNFSGLGSNVMTAAIQNNPEVAKFPEVQKRIPIFQKVVDDINEYAKNNGESPVDLSYVVATSLTEGPSSTEDKAAVSGAGAVGVMQIMPATGKELYRQLQEMFPDGRYKSDKPDPREDYPVNVAMGALYKKAQYDAENGDVKSAYLRYNMGPTGFKEARAKNQIPALSAKAANNVANATASIRNTMASTSSMLAAANQSSNEESAVEGTGGAVSPTNKKLVTKEVSGETSTGTAGDEQAVAQGSSSEGIGGKEPRSAKANKQETATGASSNGKKDTQSNKTASSSGKADKANKSASTKAKKSKKVAKKSSPTGSSDKKDVA